MMETAEVLAELERMGTAQNRKVYRHHGVATAILGLSYADLDRLKKVDHGETGCKAPAAVPDVRKARERARAKEKKAGAGRR